MEGEKNYHKKSLCRFYLRGLCIYEAKQCDFSHGIWDLNYEYWKEDEIIEYDYHKSKDDIQKNIIKGPRIYKNLFEFQTEKVFSLADINQNRTIRSEIRNMRNQQLFQEFLQLLEFKHPEVPFTEQFLLREFTRVGFNKILMGVMKFSHILSYLCQIPNAKYYKTIKISPPQNVKQNVIIRKAPYEEIIKAYKNQYNKIINSSEKPLEQNIIKKHFFTAALADGIPPVNQILKDRKLTLSDFISKQLGQQSSNIILEASIQTIHQCATEYLKQNLPKMLVSWNQVYNHVAKVLKTNNGNIINQVKPHLVLQNNLFLFFPTIQFLYNPKINSQIFKQLKLNQCKCNYQKPYPLEEFPFDTKFQESDLKEGESYDINNFESLIKCTPHILHSKILGVDLQGNLRKGGFVQMIQLNNGRNTFLIDIWDMNERGQFQTFWLARKILRNVMVDPKIVKIFHDCRHDSIGLHQMIETCIINVFDTSACQTLINQLNNYNTLLLKEKQHKDKINDCKNVIAHCNNVKTPGLNDIFKKYEAQHGINKNKDKYHKMWSKGEISFFCKRPIDPDYRQYCIRDVLDLPEVYFKMLQTIPEESIEVAYWISGLYAQSGYLNSQQEKMQKVQEK